MKNKKYKKGFTLIELLVVVLIIGVLAGFAIPQYKKSKEKATAVELMTTVRALNEAQKRFKAENGRFATQFDELMFEVSGYKSGGCEDFSVFPKTDCISNDKNVLFIHRDLSSFAFRKTGKYKKSGFGILSENIDVLSFLKDRLICYEYRKSGFCSKVLNCDLVQDLDTSNSYYTCKF